MSHSITVDGRTWSYIRVAGQYRKGCPDNAAGRRIGYGVTSKGALDAARPWANQAPYFVRRTEGVSFTDGDHRNENVIWAAIGDCMDGRVQKALLDKVWSEAIKVAVEVGWLK